MPGDDENISFRGNKETWTRFVNKIRLDNQKKVSNEKERVWKILNEWIKKYLGEQ